MIETIRARFETSWSLARASARTVRRHPRLWLFPGLSFVTSVASVLATFVLPQWLVVGRGAGDIGRMTWLAERATPGMLLLVVLGPILVGFYLLYVVASFFNVALTHATVRALAGEDPALGTALRHAASRLGAICGYALIAAAVSTLIGSIQHRSRIAPRFLPSLLGVAWSMVALLTIAVLAREKRGPLASIRRAATLVKERWGETPVVMVSLWLLLLPVVVVEAALLWRFGVPDLPASQLLALALGLALVNGAAWALQGFLATVYGSALYVFAVEGAVPGEFDVPALSSVWRASPNPPELEAGPRPPQVAPRATWAPLKVGAWIALLTLGGVSVYEAGRAWSRLQGVFGSSRSGLPLDARTFPDPFRTAWARDLPERIGSLATNGQDIFAVGLHSVYVLDIAGSVRRSFPHDFGAWPDRAFVAELANPPGRALVMTGLWAERVAAYDESGRSLWTHQRADGVDDIARIRTAGQGDLVAVGYSGFGGLCLLDGAGRESWCDQSIGNVSFVAAFDCDGDGRAEVLSFSRHSHPYYGFKLGCYSLAGKLVRDLDVPAVPLALQTRDVDADGAGDLVAWYKEGLRGPVVLAAWSGTGKPLFDLPVDPSTFNYVRGSVAAPRFHPGRAANIAVGLYNGWIVGCTPAGERWGRALAAGKAVSVLALDVDGDGAEELITASGATVIALAWARKTS
jgi:hypothetical protein